MGQKRINPGNILPIVGLALIVVLNYACIAVVNKIINHQHDQTQTRIQTCTDQGYDRKWCEDFVLNPKHAPLPVRLGK